MKLDFVEFETENLILRKLTMEDSENYYKYITDEKVSKQFNFTLTTKEETDKRLEKIVNKYEEEIKPKTWAIALKSTNQMIGILSIWNYSIPNKMISFAMGIIEEFCNQGYGEETLNKAIEEAFKWGVHRIELANSTSNTISEAVIKKTGAVFEGTLRASKWCEKDGCFYDRKLYSILKEEWDK